MTAKDIRQRGRWIIEYGLPPLRAARAVRPLSKPEQDEYHELHRELEYLKRISWRRKFASN